MKVVKSRKGYINYGLIPQNEYTTAKEGESADAAVLEYVPNPDGAAYRQRLIKRQARHPSGRRKIRGWSRSWKANGWRAEAASLQNEFSGVGRYSRHV